MDTCTAIVIVALALGPRLIGLIEVCALRARHAHADDEQYYPADQAEER